MRWLVGISLQAGQLLDACGEEGSQTGWLLEHLAQFPSRPEADDQPAGEGLDMHLGGLFLDRTVQQRVNEAFELLIAVRACLSGSLLQQRPRGEAEVALAVSRVVFVLGLLLRDLGEPMGDVVDDIDPGNVLPLQQKNGVALLLAEGRHQDVRNADLLLAAGLHVEHRTLQHALEAQCGLHLAVLALLQAGR